MLQDMSASGVVGDMGDRRLAKKKTCHRVARAQTLSRCRRDNGRGYGLLSAIEWGCQACDTA